MALLPHPAPSQVRALASDLGNLLRDDPPTSAIPREQGLGPEGLDPVCLRCAAWYQCPAAGGPAGSSHAAPGRHCTTPRRGPSGATGTGRSTISPLAAYRQLES